MPNELTDLYASLAADTDPRGMPSAAAVRRRGDRQTRAVVTAACVGVSLGVGAVACTANGLLDRSPAPAASTSSSHSPSPVPSTADSQSPASSPSASPTNIPPATAPIPDRAFFTPPANRTHTAPDKPTTGPALMPAPCQAEHPSDASIGSQRGRHILYWGVNTPDEYIADGAIDQTITVYRPGGAEAAMAEFRASVQSCPSQQLPDGATETWTMSPLSGGDDAIFIEKTWKAPPGAASDPPASTTSRLYAAVVRIGDVVTVLYVGGWERSDPDLDVTRDYARRAEAAIRQWRS